MFFLQTIAESGHGGNVVAFTPEDQLSELNFNSELLHSGLARTSCRGMFLCLMALSAAQGGGDYQL